MTNNAANWPDGVVGHPAMTLIAVFEKFFPGIPVRLVYLPGLEAWIPEGGAANTYSEIPHIVGEDKDYTDQADYYELPMDQRDWTTGALIGLKKCGDETIILIDWETTPQESVAVLMELLPRLVSNPDRHVAVGSQFTYRVARQKLRDGFEKMIMHYQDLIVDNLQLDPGLFSIVHSTLEQFMDENVVGEDEDDNEDDGMSRV